MGWQKTFTLSRRAKGCHLVTDEIAHHIQDGLKDVKVRRFAPVHFHHPVSILDKHLTSTFLHHPTNLSRRGCYSSSCSVSMSLSEARSTI